jgi:hypothetical protein
VHRAVLIHRARNRFFPRVQLYVSAGFRGRSGVEAGFRSASGCVTI